MDSTPAVYIGLDYGAKRTGVARVNSIAKIAEPLDVIETDTMILAKVSALVKTHHADGVVIGLPRSLEGKDTDQTRIARDFAKACAKRLLVPVYMIDEAGTSKRAMELQDAGYKHDLDSVAAKLIAEDFAGVANIADYEIGKEE